MNSIGWEKAQENQSIKFDIWDFENYIQVIQK